MIFLLDIVYVSALRNSNRQLIVQFDPKIQRWEELLCLQVNLLGSVFLAETILLPFTMGVSK